MLDWQSWVLTWSGDWAQLFPLCPVEETACPAYSVPSNFVYSRCSINAAHLHEYRIEQWLP